MNEVIIPFLIFITNPTGASAQMGYPVSVYERYVEKGEPAPREYHTREKCESRLRDVQSQFRNWFTTHPVMPEYRAVMTERMASMQCLPANAKPEARLRQPGTQATYRWRIGRIDEFGYFKGQNLDLRHYTSEKACWSAYGTLVVNYRESLAQRNGQDYATRTVSDFQKTYGCHAVMPSESYPHYPVVVVVPIPGR